MLVASHTVAPTALMGNLFEAAVAIVGSAGCTTDTDAGWRMAATRAWMTGTSDPGTAELSGFGHSNCCSNSIGRDGSDDVRLGAERMMVDIEWLPWYPAGRMGSTGMLATDWRPQ